MTGLAQRSADRGKSTQDGSAALAAAVALRQSDEPTLDQLLLEPIVQQLMRRDQVDEATIRHLLQQTRAARPALRAKDGPYTDDPNAIVRLLYVTVRLWRRRSIGS
jgi:hypothetical protein